MLKRVLIANRGEIAVRIIRECLDSSVEAVAVYSEADAQALHSIIASRSVCIGGGRAQDSYLNIANLIEAAKGTGCDAIHPGFGFLSENSDFARCCEEAGLVFIGPSSKVIEQMGSKAAARALMTEAGVPVVPGSDGIVKTPEEAEKIAARIGFPVLLKAANGGGGRGMRRADTPEEIKTAFQAAKAEAETCFANGDLYIEKLIQHPRHIEFQILADRFGNVVHLGERDCSIQRRNQKLVEEAPAWGLSEALRSAMGEAAVKAAKACGYENAGTVEFVVDENDRFYFIEMNTRIQVEHPVTEAVTGVNIVREQLRIASGLPLGFSQEDIKLSGHALECRITAEDVFSDFAPCPGTVDFIHFPAGAGIRVDSALYNGCAISPYYDSMVAKVIASGATRLEAVRRMRRALEEMVITGVKTTLPVQHLLMYNQDFLRGGYDTGFLETHLPEILNIFKEAGGRDESI
ncbi:acetyl-CoA carboxylase biotin carboxylase subunit [Ihubacter sp. rT4E-8]|uniref:acetyl-CoA carboxylase biotin carboxylase subunit n=1 Tax=Ihubacter sp. rT4E-8 TaxID=3242369 RepID=UPI003CF3761D